MLHVSGILLTTLDRGVFELPGVLHCWPASVRIFARPAFFAKYEVHDILVHDPFGNEDKAAAALSIGVGSFDEPKDAGVLAHLLEHMVFKGSTKFPNQGEFLSYIQERGGEANTVTENEYTCFYFDVREDFFKDALERSSNNSSGMSSTVKGVVES
ncbi:nardilysin [Phtheirospermum japonicum]|uniref:Nardilysin n=1 Tax=Phtheirospermum japonicum TaxID=374723 RepID=A0A830C7U1_9LAMI|nr:nardilysin [Phtheirospermum japonicum]